MDGHGAGLFAISGPETGMPYQTLQYLITVGYGKVFNTTLTILQVRRQILPEA
jgi:hypothetical protein